MNPMEKKHVKLAQKLLVFESGLAVSEMRQAKIEASRERIVEQHEARLEAFDPLDDDTLHNNFSGESCSCSLRDTKVEELKKPIEESDGKKM